MLLCSQPSSSHPGFTHCSRQSVLMQILPEIELRSNIQSSQKNNNLNIILNMCRIYGSARLCSGIFYFKGDWANRRRSPRKKILQTLNPEASHKKKKKKNCLENSEHSLHVQGTGGQSVRPEAPALKTDSFVKIFPLLSLKLLQEGKCLLCPWHIGSRGAAGAPLAGAALLGARAWCLWASTVKHRFFCLVWQTAEVGVLIQLFSRISWVQQLPSHHLHQNIYRKWSFAAWQHFMSHKLCLINGSKDVTQSCLEIIVRWSPAENKYCLKTTVVSSDEVSIWMLRTDSSNSWTLRFPLSRVRGATGWHEVICISVKASSDASGIAWGLGEDRGFSLHDGHASG